MDLSIARFGVLATGEHIERRTILRVVAEQKLFPCNELWRTLPSMVHVERVRRDSCLWFEILGGVCIHTKLSSPFQGGLEPFDGFFYVPFRSSEVPGK